MSGTHVGSWGWRGSLVVVSAAEQAVRAAWQLYSNETAHQWGAECFYVAMCWVCSLRRVPAAEKHRPMFNLMAVQHNCQLHDLLVLLATSAGLTSWNEGCSS